MSVDLDKVRELFVADEQDEEEKQSNLETINEWEKSIRENTAFIDWQQSDITQQIIQKAREAYKQVSLRLVYDRNVSESERHTLWAKQDAAIWILSLLARDAAGELKQVDEAVKRAINSTKM